MLHDPKRAAQIEEELFHAKLEPWQRLLLNAARQLKTRGWCQEMYYDVFGGTSVCIMGALNTAAHNTALPNPCAENYPYVVKAVGELVCYVGDIIRWNDTPSQTEANVIRTLQLVALGDA